ncbi:MAG: hypothetical protein OEY01_07125 [Desulfobulbaceae bacterium]|nr:hypothetical protein [Desulfobulbaceae bacterium]HIJ78827.1 hypothetical protein [Deltaproteobacteria bacterium]
MEILASHQFENGMRFAVYNHSKKMAGDRWLVKVVCRGEIPVRDDFFAAISESDAELVSAVRLKIGDLLDFEIPKERFFIDEAEMAEVLQGMVAQVNQNMVTYLENPEFPQRLFNKRYAEIRQACVVELGYKKIKHAEDDDTMTDFSGCFKD